jgi:aquaporin Z
VVEDTNKHRNRAVPWQLLSAELVGTALLVLAGLSLVIVMFGNGSPVARLIPSVWLRRPLSGFLFGCVGLQSRYPRLES